MELNEVVNNPTDEEIGPKPENEVTQRNIVYGIEDIPPWYLSFFLAIQHYLTMIGAIVSIPFILTPALCMEEENPAKGLICCTMILVTGLVTLIQSIFGCRLPLVQGGTISFLVPTLAILNLEKWKCPDQSIISQMNDGEKTELWQVRMRELSGAIAIASLFQVVIGATGLVGKFAVKVITPLTITPCIGLVGLTLFEHAAETASSNWGIAAGTSILLTLFSQIMAEVKVPMLTYRKGSGLKVVWFELFKLFPVLLSIAIMWIVCLVLTSTDNLDPGSRARTDTRIRVLYDAPWFHFPYPFQFGIPTVTVSAVLGMLAGVLACTVESVSYYPTVTKMCDAPAPPVHMINRGILIEGIGCILAAMWGSGNGTNTFGENVGAIGVTKIGSRRVIQWAAVIMMIQGVFGKFGALFIIVPDPVVGGMFMIMFGMITAFGISALQHVDLKSARNLYIIGVSLFVPLVVCPWVQKHPGAIETGFETLDSTLSVLLGTSILVGGALGCILDHSIPGSDLERGIIGWKKEISVDVENSEETKCYDIPYVMNFLKKFKISYHLPFLPTYGRK